MIDRLYLIARIADTRIALRSAAIHSVVAVSQPVDVPGAPPQVAGLFALRSRVFTLIDPRVRIGLRPAAVAAGQRVIVVEVDQHGYALLADAIEDARFIEAAETPIVGKLAPGWAGVAEAMIEFEGAALLVVDPSHFITRSDGERAA